MSTITVELQRRWGDMDANGHINNAVIARLFEEARVRAMGEWLSSLDSGAWINPTLVVVRQEIEFMAVLSYALTPIDAEVWFSRVGTSSIDISVVLRDAGIDVARAESTLVAVGADGRPMPLTSTIVASLTDMIEQPLPLRSRRTAG